MEEWCSTETKKKDQNRPKNEKRIECRKIRSDSEGNMQPHFPKPPVLPFVLLLRPDFVFSAQPSFIWRHNCIGLDRLAKKEEHFTMSAIEFKEADQVSVSCLKFDGVWRPSFSQDRESLPKARWYFHWQETSPGPKVEKGLISWLLMLMDQMDKLFLNREWDITRILDLDSKLPKKLLKVPTWTRSAHSLGMFLFEEESSKQL